MAFILTVGTTAIRVSLLDARRYGWAAVSIEADLQTRLKAAMREKDRAALDAIRNVRAEIQKAKTEPGYAGGDDDDTFVQSVIAAYCKKLEKAYDTYESAGDRGTENAAKLRAEIDYLSQWLPQKLDEAQTKEIVDAAIAEVGASAPGDAGKVMGAVMKAHKDEVDPKLVRSLVDAALAG